MKEKDAIEDEKLKCVRTKTVGPLKENEMLRDEKGKEVSTYADVVSTTRAP